MSDIWYYAEGQKKVGPLTLAQLAAILSRVSVAKEVLVWRSGLAGWEKAENVKELAAYLISPPPLPTPSPIVAPPPTTVQSPRIDAGLSGILTCSVWIVISIFLYDLFSTLPVLKWLFVICCASIAIAIFWKGKRKISIGIIAGTALGLLLSGPIVNFRVDIKKANALGFARVGDLYEATALGLKTPEELATRREAEAARREAEAARATAQRKQEEEEVATKRKPEQKTANQQAMAIAHQAISVARQLTWEDVEIKLAAPDSYDMTIIYKSKPKSYATVEADTRLLIRAVLTELKNAGVLEKLTIITVFTHRNVPGETGKPLVQEFGWASYNSIRDQIEFKRP